MADNYLERRQEEHLNAPYKKEARRARPPEKPLTTLIEHGSRHSLLSSALARSLRMVVCDVLITDDGAEEANAEERFTRLTPADVAHINGATLVTRDDQRREQAQVAILLQPSLAEAAETADWLASTRRKDPDDIAYLLLIDELGAYEDQDVVDQVADLGRDNVAIAIFRLDPQAEIVEALYIARTMRILTRDPLATQRVAIASLKGYHPGRPDRPTTPNQPNQ